MVKLVLCAMIYSMTYLPQFHVKSYMEALHSYHINSIKYAITQPIG